MQFHIMNRCRRRPRLSPMLARLKTYADFVKVEHMLFALPLMLGGAWLAAGGAPALRTVVLIILAGTGGRTAAFGLNRIIDREIDRRNPRTANRELPAGRMTLAEGWLVTSAGAAVYLVSAALISAFVLQWAWLPLVVFVVYPYLKRFTVLAHYGIGLADAVAPVGGYLAVKGSFEDFGPALLLGLFTLFWVGGFDIIYALMDVKFDREAGLHSLPARYGEGIVPWMVAVNYGAAWFGLALIYILKFSGNVPAAAALLAVLGVLLAGIVRWRDVEFAFFKLNAVLGSLVFAYLLIGIYWG